MLPMKRNPCQLFICVLILMRISGNYANSQINIPAEISLISLEKISEKIDTLYSKFDQLNRSLIKSCGCQTINFQTISKPYEDVQGKSETKNQESGEEINEKSNELRVSSESLHFNKLAVDSNAIHLDQSWTRESLDNSPQDWPTSSQAEIEKNPIKRKDFLPSVQHYESIFGQVLENLISLINDQFSSFRRSLAKLNNRIVDQTYQYNQISNQLSLVKEDCGLATSIQSGLMTNLTSNFGCIDSKESPQKFSRSPEVQQNVMKSSDVSMIVRLLSHEFNQQIKSSLLTTMNSPEELVTKCYQRIDEHLGRDTNAINRKLDEIGSVVKQSALYLTKVNSYINQYSPTSSSILTVAATSPVNVLTFNNLNDKGTQTNSTSTGHVKNQMSRWFSGSKIPGQSSDSSIESDKTTSAKVKVNCQSKTSLVKPTSCRQLRLAGANCTGQYYVFVKGTIRHVYCDMNMNSDDDGGGWTVILRRMNKSLISHTNSSGSRLKSTKTTHTNQLLENLKALQVNFNLDLDNYRLGFGQLAEWSEFFIGLDFLTQLTSDSPNSPGVNQSELQVDLIDDESNSMSLRFNSFRVEDSNKQFRISISPCNASDIRLCEPLTKLDGSRFFTSEMSANCSKDNAAAHLASGWWIRDDNLEIDANCTSLSANSSGNILLTAPLGLQPDGKVANLFWPNWNLTKSRPLKQIVMKIRQRRSTAALWSSA